MRMSFAIQILKTEMDILEMFLIESDEQLLHAFSQVVKILNLTHAHSVTWHILVSLLLCRCNAIKEYDILTTSLDIV